MRTKYTIYTSAEYLHGNEYSNGRTQYEQKLKYNTNEVQNNCSESSGWGMFSDSVIHSLNVQQSEHERVWLEQ